MRIFITSLFNRRKIRLFTLKLKVRVGCGFRARQYPQKGLSLLCLYTSQHQYESSSRLAMNGGDFVWKTVGSGASVCDDPFSFFVGKEQCFLCFFPCFVKAAPVGSNGHLIVGAVYACYIPCVALTAGHYCILAGKAAKQTGVIPGSRQ